MYLQIYFYAGASMGIIYHIQHAWTAAVVTLSSRYLVKLVSLSACELITDQEQSWCQATRIFFVLKFIYYIHQACTGRMG